MPDYSKSRIYKIVCDTTGLCYIGSTCETLSIRLSNHKSDYRQWLDDNSKKYITSFLILENENYHIELIEIFPCLELNELLMREGFHQLNNECVNKMIAGRTKKQYKQDNSLLIKQKNKIYNDNHFMEQKLYREQNSIIIAEKQKLYREQNKDILAKKQSIAYQANKVIIAEKQKLYREQNKVEINQRRKEHRLAKKLLSVVNL